MKRKSSAHANSPNAAETSIDEASHGASAPPESLPEESTSGASVAAHQTALDDVSIPVENRAFQTAIEPQQETPQAAKESAGDDFLHHVDASGKEYSPHESLSRMSTHVAQSNVEGDVEEARSRRADREYLSEQVIGQSPLLPPRQPLGARLATLMGRRHGVLLALCTLGLWAAMTLRPNVQGEYQRGAIASQDILAPRAATLPDRKLTEARKRDAAALVAAVYDGNPDALALALARLRAVAAARRDLPASFVASNTPGATSPSTKADSKAESGAQSSSFAARGATARGATARGATAASPANRGNARRMSTHVAASDAISRFQSETKGEAQGKSQTVSPAQIAAQRQKETVREAARQKALDAAARQLNQRLLNNGARLRLPQELARGVVQIATERWKATQSAGEASVRAAYSSDDHLEPVRSDHLADDLAAARRRGEVEAKRQGRINRLSEREIQVAVGLAREAVRRPNLLVNARKTEMARQDARNDVNAVSRDIKLGDLLVAAGNVIDDDKWALLQDMDLVASRFDPALALARLVLCFVLVLFCASYVARFHPQLMSQPTSLWLAAFVPVAFVAFFRVMLRVPGGDGAMIPLVATGAMLLTILLNARIGLVGAFTMTALCAVMAHADSGLYLATMLGASIGVLGVADISSRVSLLRAAGMLSLANVALCFAAGILRGTSQEQLVILATWAAAAGGLSVVVTYCLVMFLERPFGITTHLRLLELSAPDEAVLRRMQSEAPGTYTHSVMVAQLSEMAAKEVGADPLLCRVGGLYHDIGKLRRPHCFIENQSGDNVHDRLSPQMSALLIVAHVKDGLELGRALQLPQPVLDIIAQHHGATLISYFYDRANREMAQHQNQRDAATHLSPYMSTHAAAASEERGAMSIVNSTNGANGNDAAAEAAPRSMDESLFRYPGPRPQSKEAALVLLADTIEASARALPDLTPERLEAHIKAMVSARLASGELAECELTMRDLGIIERSFAHVLRGVLHQRIAYPDPDREMKMDAATRSHARDWMRGHHTSQHRTSEHLHSERHEAGSSKAETSGANGSAAHDAAHSLQGANGTSHKVGSARRHEDDMAERRGERRCDHPDRRQARRQAAEISSARDATVSVLTAHLNHHAKTDNNRAAQAEDSGSASVAAIENIADNSNQNAREHHLEQRRAPLHQNNGIRTTGEKSNSTQSNSNGHIATETNANGNNNGNGIPVSIIGGGIIGDAEPGGAARDTSDASSRPAQNFSAAPIEP